MGLAAYDGISMLRSATARHNIHLSVLVAEVALWADPDVHRRLVGQNGSGAYFPSMRRYRIGAGERRGEVRGGEKLDTNSYANHAIKQAIGIKRKYIVGFEACHIWQQTVCDARYYTCIANLVLIPSPIAGLSDHDPDIQAALQFRSYELYGWYPAECQPPIRPQFYPTNWRQPMPFTATVVKALENRKLGYLPSQPH